MQPSDLDKKILPLSPSYAKKQNRASDPTASSHLSAVPQSRPNHINNHEMSLKDISENNKNWTSEKSNTDFIEKEDKSTKAEANGQAG